MVADAEDVSTRSCITPGRQRVSPRGTPEGRTLDNARKEVARVDARRGGAVVDGFHPPHFSIDDRSWLRTPGGHAVYADTHNGGFSKAELSADFLCRRRHWNGECAQRY